MKLYKAFKITLVVCALPIALLLSPARAAKQDGYKAKVLAKYDKDGDGLIREREAERLQEDFKAEPAGWLSKLDKNRDGILQDAEITEITPGKNAAGSEKEGD